MSLPQVELIQAPHHVINKSLPPLPTALGRPALDCKLTSKILSWKPGLANISGLCLGLATDTGVKGTYPNYHRMITPIAAYDF